MSDDKLEWKRNVEIYETQTGDIKPLDAFIKHYSAWYRFPKGVGWLIRFIDYLRGSSVPADVGTLGRDDVTGAGMGCVTVDELRDTRKRQAVNLLAESS